MTLPHASITPIPDTEPDAVPSLWNTRYSEIDQNFGNHESRVGSLESEVAAARGGAGSIDARLDLIEADVEGLDPEFQNNLIAAVLAATDMAALANKEVDRTRRVRIQEGIATIYNRGIMSGCTITRKAANVRMLSLSTGKMFMHGRSYTVSTDADATSVPVNSTGATAISYVYLYIDGSNEVQAHNEVQAQCTPLGAAVPSGGVLIYSVSVPVGSVGDSDAFTITDVRRLETGWPKVFTSPAYANISLPYIMPDANYAVHAEVASCEGGRQQIGDLEVADRATNGFKLYLGGAADAVAVRYTVRRMI